MSMPATGGAPAGAARGAPAEDEVWRVLDALRTGRVPMPRSRWRRAFVRWHAHQSCRSVRRALTRADVPTVVAGVACRSARRRWRLAQLPQALADADEYLHRPPHSPRDQCLARSIVHARYLWLCGLPAVINIGLFQQAASEGHAWVTVDGRLVLEESDRVRAYVVLVSRTPHLAYWLTDPGGDPHV